jgi:hypothetical protein
MGLDQYAHKVKSSMSEDHLTETITKTKIHQWRKHYPLQQCFEALWESNGGDGDFNCVDVSMIEDDLNRLEKAILNDEMPWEEWMGEEETEKEKADTVAYDLEFIKKAREAMADGWEIVYSSWF